MDPGAAHTLSSMPSVAPAAPAPTALASCCPSSSSGVAEGLPLFGPSALAPLAANSPAGYPTIPVGGYPWGLAYDPGASRLFVTHWNSPSVTVVSTSNNSVVASVTVGATPHFGLAYDSAKGEVFLADSADGNSSLSVLSAANDVVVATVAVGNDPYGVAYDPAAGRLFVTNHGSDNVSVISDANNSTVATVAVGVDPVGVAYDAAKGQMFVVDEGGQAPGFGGVSVISTGTDSVVANVSLGGNPFWVAYDSAKGEMFVTVDNNSNPRSGLVEVVSDTTDSVVATIPVGPSPGWPIYLPGSGEVFVANANSNNVSVISDATNTVVATIATGASPLGLAYDSAAGEVYVADLGSAALTVTPGPAYTVTVTETGLPTGGNWSVTAGGSTSSSTTTVATVVEPNGTYSLVAVSANSSFAAPRGSFTVNGSRVSVSVTFSLVTYLVTFTEQGLANGTQWYAGLNGAWATCESNLCGPAGFREPNGSYSVVVAAPIGYSINRSNGGMLTVHGAALTEAYGFSLLPAFHVVSFVESGLPNGSNWSVDVPNLYGAKDISFVSSTQGVISFPLPNGSYTFLVEAATAGPGAGFGPEPAYGAISVNGTNLSEAIHFVPGTEVVVVYLGGPSLPFLWFVNVTGGPSYNSTFDFLAFVVPNGSHQLVVGSSNTSWAGPEIRFAGSGLATFEVTLRLVTYAVYFTESGIATKTVDRYGWTVAVGGTLERVWGASARFVLPNGTYRYVVSGPAGYDATTPRGNLVVQGADTNVPVTFAAGATVSLVFAEHGLPRGSRWCVEVGQPVASQGWEGCSTTPLTVFRNLTPSSYGYAILPEVGQTITAKQGTTVLPLAGTLSVGASTRVVLTYGYYSTLTFTESGLPTGTSWSVTVRAVLHRTIGTVIQFNETNGTYYYTVGAEAGYTIAVSPKSVLIAGAARSVAVTFTRRTAAGLDPPSPDALLLLVSPGRAGVLLGPSWGDHDIPAGGWLFGLAGVAALFAGATVAGRRTSDKRIGRRAGYR
jgi:YVTN family beta-propeller protein